ncbi:MAG: NapC/NirT family cytochrome c [Candidatus Binatus sp.]|jgi:cytochrome c nitrite reductase small subunit
MSTGQKLLLLLVLGVAPALVTLATFALSFQRAEHVAFCADCHTMTPWIADLENPKSKSLAATHFGNRWIQNDQCYTCHADYGFLGPIRTKLESMGHVARYYGFMEMPKQITLYKPFPNSNCLQCHGPAAGFQNNPAHVAVMKPILANQLSCVTCHQPIHTPVG